MRDLLNREQSMDDSPEGYGLLAVHPAVAARHAFPPNSTSLQAGRLTRELSLTRHFGLPVYVARRPPPPFTEPRRAIESLP